ncbi:Jasmonate-zim-domain protein 6, putative isoform 1 [Hibiscus syriacus]|uniref:Jasmonate-zim-domain protein 6, putative isoform 1 n=1 Tax=Hibiscus syriacus TaxID=106335 RepID=A0A6A3A8C2_HIBSY|nr:Jasmonate-zim-domain protein 6, putative isoform 1 [Hibiscus syriacus]
MAIAWLFGRFLLFLSSTFFVLLPSAFSASDSEALLKLKKSLTNAGVLDSWVPGSPPCNGPQGPWRGLVCEGGVVTGLRLEGMGLSGTIDVDALVQMKGLGSFSVENNSFTDNILELNRLELVIVNNEKGVFGLTDLMKASAEVLGNGPLGSSYKVKMANGVEVTVKRVHQMNALGSDAFDAEVKKLRTLRHPNVLTPLAYHYRKEEKLFVYQYLRNSSLLYHLHGDGESGGVLDWPTRVKIVRGIVKGLVTRVSSQRICFTRRLEGLFCLQNPGAIQKQTVSPKSDVYCLGIIIIEMLTGERPSRSVYDGNGVTDIVQWVASAFSEGRRAELLDTKIEGCRNSICSMEKLLRVGALCTNTSLEERIGIKEAVRTIQEIHELRIL